MDDPVIIPQPNRAPILIASAISGLIFLSLGFLLGRNLPSKPSVVIPTPSLVSIPTTAPDITVNWKTYTNKKCGYQVKYPTDWQIIPESEGAIYGSTTIYPYEVGSGIKPPDDWFKLQIGCAGKNPGSTPRNIVDSLNQRDDGYGIPQVENIEQTNLNGTLTFKQTIIPSVGPRVLEYYIFPTGDKYYSLGFTPADTKSTDTIDQILSTFQFLK